MMGEAIAMESSADFVAAVSEPRPSPRDLQLNVYNKVTFYSF